MRPRLLLLIAATLLAAVHFIGVLFVHAVWRPAGLAATLCLLAAAVLAERSAPDPDGDRRWWLTAATAVLVVQAALTVPPAPHPDAGAGWQILSPEQYSGLLWRNRIDSALPVLAVLLFVLILLVARHRHRPGRAHLAALIAAGAAVVLLAVAAAQSAAALQQARDEPATDTLWTGLTVLLPATLTLAALALAVTTARRRHFRALTGALLLALVGLAWAAAAAPFDSAEPFESYDPALPYTLGLLQPTAVLPHPFEALTTALVLAAAVLTVSGATSRNR